MNYLTFSSTIVCEGDMKKRVMKLKYIYNVCITVYTVSKYNL